MFLVGERRVLYLLLGEIQHSLGIRGFLHRWVFACLSCVPECLLELICRVMSGAEDGGRGRLQRYEQLLEKKWVWMLPDRGTRELLSISQAVVLSRERELCRFAGTVH